MVSNEDLDTLMGMVEDCKDVKQRPDYHPEVNVMNHLLQTFDHALRESWDFELILAALLHDVGKAITPYGHDRIGAAMIKPYCTYKTWWLVEQHTRFWYWINGEMRRVKKVQELTHHRWLCDLAQLARWDRMGRNPNKQPFYERSIILDQLRKVRDEN